MKSANETLPPDAEVAGRASSAQRSAIVAGAGLAGLTAAIDLVDAGWQVTLVERRPFAGGRTFSFVSPDGDLLDNGQHVFLGCCSAYLALLEKLGQRDKVWLQPRLEVRLLDARDGPARLKAMPLPAPLHLLPSFWALPYLTWREKLSAAHILLQIRLRDLPRTESFACWLRRHGQSANAIRRFWDIIVIPTCNAPADRVSAAQAGFVYREGLLRTTHGSSLGYARVGLSEVVPDAAIAYLQAHGASVLFDTTIQRLEYDASSSRPAPVLAALARDGRRVEANAFVLAVPWDEAARLTGEPWAAAAAALPTAPIIGVNLWYDRPIFNGEVLAVLTNSDAYWLFDRSRILGRPTVREHHVAVSISAADGLLTMPRSSLAHEVASRLAQALPAAREAHLLRSGVSKVRQATFVPSPAAQPGRLEAMTPHPNLFLAGAWTDTGWPDTMEGAIRSGHTAARLASLDARSDPRQAQM